MPIPVDPKRLRKALELLRAAGPQGITKEAFRRGLSIRGDRATVSDKTVERCIKRLNEDDGNIESVMRGGRRVFIMHDPPPWDLQVSPEAKLALRMATLALCQSGTLLWQEHLSFIEEVADSHMSIPDRGLFTQLDRAIHVSGGSEDSVEGPSAEILGPILAALADSRRIRVEYLAAGRVEPVIHDVVPYAITHDLFAGGAYLLSWSPHNHFVTPLRLNRIARIEVLPVLGIVDHPEKLDRAKKYSIGGWFSSQAPFQVAVRVHGKGWVQSLLDCPPALPDYDPTPEDGGRSLLVKFRTNRPEGALRWVLQFGECAEILEPGSLRAAIRTKLEKALATYPADPTNLG